ncbi:MAG TPA: triose-phosphate isomerase [bacterium]|nr:triose-phosphate isomerase [bacterium]HPT30167.1 triose-phosphate isomerase [bacterium]
MNNKILVANWKMQLTSRASQKLAKQLVASPLAKKKTVIICPDFSELSAVGKTIKASAMFLGAQNVSAFLSGAYTGQVSVASLKELGVKYIILGHSEAREYGLENDALIKQKLTLVLAAGLTPILCVGEKRGEKTEEVLRRQLSILKGLKLKKNSKIIVAYEPVWAIGSGQALAAVKANEYQAMIKLIVKEYTKLVPPVLYGGSVKEENVKSFAAQPYIDGLLVGGASLQAKSFNNLAKIILA